MTGRLRAAWICSYIAPVGGTLTLLSMALAIAAGADDSRLHGLRSALAVSALALGAVSVIAHVVFLYRVHKGTGLSRDEASRLAGKLQFGIGYAEWRRAIGRSGPDRLERGL